MRSHLCSLLLIGSLVSAVSAAPAFVWREAETPDKANFTVKPQGGPPELISGAQWVNESLDKPDLGKLGEGRDLQYTLNVPAAGGWNLWIRLGLEGVRAPLNWRFDTGEWHTIGPKDLTHDLIELGDWYEIGWFGAGQVDLTAGPHTLELKADKPNGDRFILALDAICLVQGEWTPDAVLKPGEAPASELDQTAAKQTFMLPEPKDTATRLSTPLDGAWQVGRFDDQSMGTNTFEPEDKLPTGLVWRGTNVPADLFKQPVLNFAHRVVYRTQLDVPPALAGRSLLLDFAGTNWIATVFVNGQRCGWQRGTRMPWQCDITKAVKTGVNDIAVTIKSPWYGLNPAGNKSVDEMRTLPFEFWKHVRQLASFYPSTKGDTDGMAVGLTDPVKLLVLGGPAYVTDVFVKPKVVGGKELGAEVTLTNSSAKPATAEITCSAVFDGTGKVEKSFAPKTVVLPPGQSAVATLNEPFAEARLWWPGDDPAALYRFRTEVKVDGQMVDRQEETFGFRDVTIDGKFIRINGVRRNFWNLLAGFRGDTDQAKLAHFKQGNNRFERFSMDLGHELGGPLEHRRAQLDWADRHGIPGRMSTMIDGMFITHELNNPVTWKHFSEQIEQAVRQNRNHPSVIVYSLENELMFITAALAYRGDIDRIERDVKTNLFDVAHKWDPTRPAMLDGGGAMKDNSAEICCTHYLEDGFHPDLAVGLDGQKSQGLWGWDEKRPYAAGEVGYFSGSNADQAWIGGESAASGKAESLKAYAKYLRYLFERYRWNDVAITCPWTGQDGTEDCHSAMSDLAAFVRLYNGSLFGGEKVERELKVFNDTWTKKPVTFTWSFLVDGKKLAGETRTLTIEPGFSHATTIAFTPPAVTQRTEGTLWLKVEQAGAKTYSEPKTYAVFPRRTAQLAITTTRPIFVLDADGRFAPTLAQAGVTAKPITAAGDAAPGGIIVVAPRQTNLKAVTPGLVSYAKAGGRVICLEQTTPWQGDDLPAPLTQAKERNKRDPIDSNLTFGQGFGMPMLAQLGEDDLSSWSGDEPTAARLWEKPSGAARSWIASGPGLAQCALIELPVGPGEILATQMRVGAKLAIEPAAQQLLSNLLTVADRYAPPSATVTLCAAGDWATLVKGLGVKLREVPNPADGLDLKVSPILVVQATPANLASLSAAKAKTDAFTAAGGWILLCGLEPEGLAAANQILGTQHVMREFRVERVKLQRDLLLSGLDSPDVTMYGTEMIAPWAGIKRVSSDVFSYCVDAGPNVAPFCFGPPNPKVAFTPGGGPLQLVNGLFNADFWHYIDQIGYTAIPPELVLHTFPLPGPTRLKSVHIWNNANYDTVKDCEIRVDGKPAAKVELPNSFEDIEVPLGGIEGKSVALVAQSVRKRQDKTLVGLDEVQIVRETPSWAAGGRVVPLVDIGGLVKYPRGKGGWVLNQLKPTDPVKENLTKKQRIVAVLLQNLGAAFDGK